MDRRRGFLTLLLSCALASASCAPALFKVKPVSELPSLPSTAHSADAGNVTIRVGSLLTDEQSQELFEANVPVAGVLPVRLELNFHGDAAVELKKAKFKVRDNQNREWKLLTTKQAVSLIMKSNDIYAYNPHSKKQFEEDMGAYTVDVKTPLDSSQRNRSGFLFFLAPDKQPVDTNSKLTLVIEKLGQPVSIELN
ncbi:MAG TPA: hypothetical protein VI306_09990 [Pyrinomonadaceae bacterium]